MVVEIVDKQCETKWVKSKRSCFKSMKSFVIQLKLSHWFAKYENVTWDHIEHHICTNPYKTKPIRDSFHMSSTIMCLLWKKILNFFTIRATWKRGPVTHSSKLRVNLSRYLENSILNVSAIYHQLHSQVSY